MRYVVGLISSPYLDTLTKAQYDERMYDKYMTGYTWMAGGLAFYRYFEGAERDQAAAKDYCARLLLLSALAQKDFMYSTSDFAYFIVGPIGQKVLGYDGLGTLTYWANVSGDPHVQTIGPVVTDAVADAAEKHAVICRFTGTPF